MAVFEVHSTVAYRAMVKWKKPKLRTWLQHFGAPVPSSDKRTARELADQLWQLWKAQP